MADRLLRRDEVAELMGTSPGVAVSILDRRGCRPIDFGPGRARGLRWLESAVLAIIRTMHQEAQPAPKNAKVKKPSPVSTLNLANISCNELYDCLTRDKPLQ